MVSFSDLSTQTTAIAVVGLGYVGLPLAVALSRHFSVIGFDVNQERIAELAKGTDRTGEVDEDVLKTASVEYTADPELLGRAGVVIVAVPTPIDGHRAPDLRPIKGASSTVGKYMAPGTCVVYESTVYPGLTEDICVPILENESGLACGKDFTVGYSPERINPGDRKHTLETIVKVVAGQDQATLDLLAELYGTVVSAGVHKASSIMAAEAAKVIENTQRDLNIALMNELALIFDLMDIDTLEVLEAAGTKWNFLPFRPGLVGGHCIGVDPYYLTFKAQELGYNPQVILAGRKINDTMAKHVAEKAVKMLIKNGCVTCGARIGVLGLTFKENVPDLRNTKVIDVVRELEEYTAQVLVHDPLADPKEAREEYGLDLVGLDSFTDLDAVILAVSHEEYKGFTTEIMNSWYRDQERRVLLDLKGLLDPAAMLDAGYLYWRL